MIVLLNGLSATGKSTFAHSVCSIVGINGSVELSTVDLIKEAAALIGWQGAKRLKDREFLYKLKCLSRDYYDFPVTDTVERTETFLDWAELNGCPKEKAIVFVNTRDPEEIARFQQIWGDMAISLIVKKPDNEVPMSPADLPVMNYKYDEIIENDGSLYDLGMKALAFVEKYNLQTKKPINELKINAQGLFD